jgi:hypothetical protein
MNNSTKRRRVEEHDKAQKKSGYPFADSLADASSAIRRLGNGCKQHHRRARHPWLGCDIVRQQGFCVRSAPRPRHAAGHQPRLPRRRGYAPLAPLRSPSRYLNKANIQIHRQRTLSSPAARAEEMRNATSHPRQSLPMN